MDIWNAWVQYAHACSIDQFYAPLASSNVQISKIPISTWNNKNIKLQKKNQQKIIRCIYERKNVISRPDLSECDSLLRAHGYPIGITLDQIWAWVDSRLDGDKVCIVVVGSVQSSL